MGCSDKDAFDTKYGINLSKELQDGLGVFVCLDQLL